MNPKIATRRVSLLLMLFTLCAVTALAQTSVFTYQGRLTDGGTPATGTYDLQFALFDTVSGGAQIGAPQTSPNVSVSAGIFTVQLDFGATAFPGAPRFLEINARLSGAASFTTLSPRQQITSTPYAIRSLNASSADAVTVTGVPGGSGNYIQNNPPSQQAGSFNISGNGTVNGSLSGTVVLAREYLIPGAGVILSSPGANGALNTIIGTAANLGSSNLTNATAIGASARVDQSNALVLGSVAGVNGASSSVNVGIGTTTPATALEVNGLVRSTRSGVATQYIQLHGGDSGSIKLTAQSTVGAEKSLFIQSLSGEATPGANNTIQFQVGTTASPSTKMIIDKGGNVGIGQTTPTAKLNVKGIGGDVLRVDNSSGLSGLVVRDDRIVAIGLLSSLEAASTHVCVDSLNRLSFCSSSLRYKQQVAPYTAGLDLIRRLRPISFTWKGNGTRDLGLGAEDVAKVEPLLVTHNDKGEIQGVKYDQLNVVLINAVKQQQDQIARQQLQIEQLQQQQKLIKLQEGRGARQQQQIASLKRLVCLNHRRAGICK